MTQLTSTTNEPGLSLIDAIVYQAVGENETLAVTIKSNIQAHTNAEIAKVLDRLERNKETLYWWTGGEYDRTTAVDMRAIQAERARLKEVK